MVDAKLSHRKKQPPSKVDHLKNSSGKNTASPDRDTARNGSASREEPRATKDARPVKEAASWRNLLRIFHWGSLLAQFIITSISLTFLYVDTYFWPLVDRKGFLDTWACVHLLVFCASSFLTQYNFLMAIYVGPGYVPSKWIPEDKSHTQKLQWCAVCEGTVLLCSLWFQDGKLQVAQTGTLSYYFRL